MGDFNKAKEVGNGQYQKFWKKSKDSVSDDEEQEAAAQNSHTGMTSWSTFPVAPLKVERGSNPSQQSRSQSANHPQSVIDQNQAPNQAQAKEGEPHNPHAPSSVSPNAAQAPFSAACSNMQSEAIPESTARGVLLNNSRAGMSGNDEGLPSSYPQHQPKDRNEIPNDNLSDNSNVGRRNLMAAKELSQSDYCFQTQPELNMQMARNESHDGSSPQAPTGNHHQIQIHPPPECHPGPPSQISPISQEGMVPVAAPPPSSFQQDQVKMEEADSTVTSDQNGRVQSHGDVEMANVLKHMRHHDASQGGNKRKFEHENEVNGQCPEEKIHQQWDRPSYEISEEEKKVEVILPTDFKDYGRPACDCSRRVVGFYFSQVDENHKERIVFKSAKEFTLPGSDQAEVEALVMQYFISENAKQSSKLSRNQIQCQESTYSQTRQNGFSHHEQIPPAPEEKTLPSNL